MTGKRTWVKAIMDTEGDSSMKGKEVERTRNYSSPCFCARHLSQSTDSFQSNAFKYVKQKQRVSKEANYTEV